METLELRDLTQVLQTILRENTGKALCDSGDFYGRHYDINSRVDLIHGPEIRTHVYSLADKKVDKRGLVKVKLGDVSLTYSLFHFLKSNLTITEESEVENTLLQEKLDAITDWWDTSELAQMEEFTQERHDGEEEYGVNLNAWNTYNGESLLSQVIQYTVYHRAGEYPYGNYFCVLQVHNGCDVRGGYTTPQVFSLNEDEGNFLHNHAEVSAWDEESEQSWNSYDAGYSFDEGEHTEALSDILAYNPTTNTFHHWVTGTQIHFSPY